MSEIIQCIEQDDEFREKYYDNIDRLVDEQESAKTTPRRIPSIYPVPLTTAQEKPHA